MANSLIKNTPELFTLALMCVSTFVFCLIFYNLLLKIGRRESGKLRSLFYIPARKSTTDAVQFGGLPLSLSMILNWLILALFGDSIFSFNKTESAILGQSILPGLTIMIYGYLDDKFELRPIVKLFAQFTAITIFALFTSRYLFPSFSSLSFLVVSFFGIGVVNGQNLLDGLDTITIKLSAVSYFQFFGLGLYFGLFGVWSLAILSIVPLCAFYFYNKEPAKIHLGEIGGAFVGLSLIVLSTFFHRAMILKDPSSIFSSSILALMPLTLPMGEIAVSFTRRLLNGKSPFMGDKFHVHHILHNYWKWSATKSANVMALGYFFITLISFLVAISFHPVAGYVLMILMMSGAYFSIGKKYWFKGKTLEFSAKSMFQYIRKKDVMLIETTIIDEFQITLIDHNNGEKVINDRPKSSTRERRQLNIENSKAQTAKERLSQKNKKAS